MKNKIIKILYIVDNLIISNGVSTVAMNYFRKVNQELFQIDFLVLSEYSMDKETYLKEIQENGGKVFFGNINYSIKNIINIRKFIKRFFVANEYDIVELHVPTLSYLILKQSNFSGNKPIRIIHTHSSIKSSNRIKNCINSILNFNITKYGDYYFGCSVDSGTYWFGQRIINNNRFFVITNATDITKYAFNMEKRVKLRKKFQIEEKIVLGFVGRISKDKNLNFIIDVMKKISNKNIKLLLIGKESNDIKRIKEMIKNQKNIELIGFRNDVNDLYNMLDYLVLCSKREGLPMVAVEAQLNGLNCILSDTITKEVDIGFCKYVPLNKNKWIEMINNLKPVKNRNYKIDSLKFDINSNSEKLEKIYLEMIEGKKYGI